MSIVTQNRLGDFVRSLREERLWSREDIVRRAKRAGYAISQSYVQQIEQGDIKSPSLDKLDAIAEGLGVAHDLLIGIARGEDISHRAPIPFPETGATSSPFGEMLVNARKARNWTQEHLAEKVGISGVHIGYLERGKREPSREIVIALADLFGWDRDDALLSAGYAPEGAIKRAAIIEWPGGVDPRTDDEKRIMADAAAIGLDEFGALSEPGFWDLPPEERRGLFRDIEGAIEETRRIYKQIGKKMPGE